MLSLRPLARPARVLPLLLVAAIFLAAAVLLLQRGGDAPVAPRLADAEQPTGPPSDAYAVLRESPDRGLPADARRLLTQGGLPTASPQAVDVGLPVKGWVTASDATVCLSVPMFDGARYQGFSNSCSPSVPAQTSGVSNTHFDSPEAMDAGDPMAVYALVPDGVASVAVTEDDGSVTRRPVRENTVHVDARVGDEVAYADADGERHVLSPTDPRIVGGDGS